MDWEDKAKLEWVQAEGYSWSQTVGEVKVRVPLGEGLRSRQVDYALTPHSLRVGVKGAATPVAAGELWGLVTPGESLWTIEGGVVEVVLQKQKKHESWSGLFKGGAQADPLTKERMDKAMMLEKFQSEHKGFDFSGAEFSGALPADPASFGDSWKNK